jgi:molecular chaperone GrpE
MMILGKTNSKNAEFRIPNSASKGDEAPESEIRNPESQDEGDAADGLNGNSVTGGDGANDTETVNDNGKIDADKPDNAKTESGITDSDLKKDLATERDRYLRLAAEYDNFRKRSAKEREKVYNDARADTITKLLPVYDNLERALKMECADEAFLKGVEMTMTQLTGILKALNVQEIPAIGEPFDPNLHNAVMAIENPDLGEKIVAEEFQKGFMIGERVIRHSTVVVAN